MTFEPNKIYNIDNLEGMKQLPDNFFKCTITSPPYNVGLNHIYEEGKQLKYKTKKEDVKENYFEWLSVRLKEMIRVSEYVFFNIQSLAKNKIEIIMLLNEYRQFYKDEIIWTKQGQPAMERGVLNSCFEHIYIFSKNRPEMRKFYGYDFRGTLKNVQTFGQVGKNPYTSIHKAQFPQSLPDFFIENFCKEGDNVLDPFCGIGTTGVSAIQHGCNFIGFDVEQEYVTISNDRLQGQIQNEVDKMEILSI
jgi:site-specific DNA-methyltransferase (adenine-specific)/modification methylase